MALIVSPPASAESYVSVVDADAYHLARGATAWAAGVTADKEAALRRATAWIDGAYGERWPGYRTNRRAQLLDWPRTNAYDAEGEAIGTTELPVELIQATCEAALRELVTPGGLSPDVTQASIVRSEQVGPLAVTYAASASISASRPVVTVIEDILEGLIGGGTSGATTFLNRA